MISYCGIDCSKCESYLATQANSDMERKKIAEQCLIDFKDSRRNNFAELTLRFGSDLVVAIE